jgi:hypothetical protein
MGNRKCEKNNTFQNHNIKDHRRAMKFRERESKAVTQIDGKR